MCARARGIAPDLPDIEHQYHRFLPCLIWFSLSRDMRFLSRSGQDLLFSGRRMDPRPTGVSPFIAPMWVLISFVTHICVCVCVNYLIRHAMATKLWPFTFGDFSRRAHPWPLCRGVRPLALVEISLRRSLSPNVDRIPRMILGPYIFHFKFALHDLPLKLTFYSISLCEL